jgi:phosphonate transport system permease protein
MTTATPSITIRQFEAEYRLIRSRAKIVQLISVTLFAAAVLLTPGRAVSST